MSKISTTAKVLIFVAVFTVLSTIATTTGVLGYLGSTKNTAVQYENTIVSYNAAMENSSSKTWKTVQGIAKVNDKYIDAFKSVVTEYTQGRKLSDDAVFAAVNEAVPNLDNTTFNRIMDAMDSGYKEFADQQDRKIQEVKNYKTWMESTLFMRKWAMGMVGYPKIDIEKEMKVISTKEAKEIMETGEDKGVDI